LANKYKRITEYKVRQKNRHIHETPRKTGVDLNAPEDLTEASNLQIFIKCPGIGVL
jgi:hypothetical protein